jgi:hypothetical protein
VEQKAGFFWDTVIVESTGGVDLLVVQKRIARVGGATVSGWRLSPFNVRASS